MIGELTLVWLGTVAGAATAGMFINMDRVSNIVLPFVAAAFWGTVALSSGEVALTDTDPVVTTALEPVLFLTGTMALLCTAYGVGEMLFGGRATPDDPGEPDNFDL